MVGAQPVRRKASKHIEIVTDLRAEDVLMAVRLVSWTTGHLAERGVRPIELVAVIVKRHAVFALLIVRQAVDAPFEIERFGPLRVEDKGLYYRCKTSTAVYRNW